ncbi:MAG: hypothetical protein K6B14_07965, partial [Lachnospiraceae bacterium]|nr:hypothetical protein [Lachnospiraceae bacterium]
MTMITDINSANMSFYSPMFPKGVMDDVMADETALMFGIEHEDAACGVIAVRMTRPEAEVFWYWLDPGFRGDGIGSKAFLKFCTMMYYRYSMSTVSMELSNGADPRIKRMFMGYGSVTSEQLPECRFTTTLGWLRSSERLERTARDKEIKSVALSAIPDYEITVFTRELRAAGVDYIEFPIEKGDFIADASAVYAEGSKPVGILLLQKRGQQLEIPYMASISTNPMAVLDMVSF